MNSKPKKNYVLSDGRSAYKIQSMTEAEWKDANRKAEEATDGNFSWYELRAKDLASTVDEIDHNLV